MIDIVSKEKRSSMMAAVPRQNTRPEMALRRALHAEGLRYRLHRRELPGTPDIVFAQTRIAVFVHGCFWHRHDGCRRATTPASRTEFWLAKFQKNVERDKFCEAALKAHGWRVIVIWECEVSTAEAARRIAKNFAQTIQKGLE
jgi:DNA mismatch endonuclease (patch repair protein)